MRCSRCSGDIPEGNSYCPGCGLKVRIAGPGPQQPPAAPQYAPPIAPVAPQPQAPSEVYYPPPDGPSGARPGYQGPPPQYYPPQGPPGGPQYPVGGGAYAARPMDRNTWIQIIAICYVGLYFLVAAAVILSNSSGGAATVLGIAGIIGTFAAVAVPGYVLFTRGEYDPLGVLVMVAAGVAALFLTISAFAGNGGLARFSAVLAGIAVVGSQTALLLFMRANKNWFRYTQYAAIGIAWLAGIILAVTAFRFTSINPLTSTAGLAGLSKASSIFLLMDVCASVIAILVWRLALKYGG
jgi:hypothetical protein